VCIQCTMYRYRRGYRYKYACMFLFNKHSLNIRVCVYVYTYIHLCVRVHVHTHMHVFVEWICAHTHACVHSRENTAHVTYTHRLRRNALKPHVGTASEKREVDSLQFEKLSVHLFNLKFSCLFSCLLAGKKSSD